MNYSYDIKKFAAEGQDIENNLTQLAFKFESCDMLGKFIQKISSALSNLKALIKLSIALE